MHATNGYVEKANFNSCSNSDILLILGEEHATAKIHDGRSDIINVTAGVDVLISMSPISVANDQDKWRREYPFPILPNDVNNVIKTKEKWNNNCNVKKILMDRQSI